MASVLSQPLHIVVSRASESAIRAVEKAGGSITCKFYTPLSLRALIKPEKWTDRGRLLPNESVPIGRKELSEFAVKLSCTCIISTIADHSLRILHFCTHSVLL